VHAPAIRHSPRASTRCSSTACCPLAATASRDAGFARSFRLDRRTWHRAVRAEDATIASLGPQSHTARGADVDNLARICRHALGFCGAASRASDNGLIDHGSLIGKFQHSSRSQTRTLASRTTWNLDQILSFDGGHLWPIHIAPRALRVTPSIPCWVSFPIAFFVSTFICDLVFWQTANAA
jgi:hypothetical protein